MFLKTIYPQPRLEFGARGRRKSFRWKKIILVPIGKAEEVNADGII
jgi:hypothetical protein